VIIWLNGTFGAGKTTTARQLAGLLPNARVFDPEQVGYLLMTALEDHASTDFQDLPPWRELVPVFTKTIARFTGQHLVAAQTVLRADYWHELTEGFARTPLDLFHVLLHVDSEALAERIKADEVEASARQWRLDHISDYEKSRSWLEAAADLVMDTTSLSAIDVAERLAVAAASKVAAAGKRALLALILLTGVLVAATALSLLLALLAALSLLAALALLAALPLVPADAELALHGVFRILLTLFDLLRMLLRFLLGVVLQVAELAHHDLLVAVPSTGHPPARPEPSRYPPLVRPHRPAPGTGSRSR
jgi:AAA domain